MPLVGVRMPFLRLLLALYLSNLTHAYQVCKAWFKRRILHAPNQIQILVDSNEYVRLI